jgi:hypothetical protein
MFQQILQFPDVAGVIHFGQGLHDRWWDLVDVFADPGVDLGYKVPHQQFDVLPVLPQGRDGDGVDLEAVKQVGPETAVLDFIL